MPTTVTKRTTYRRKYPRKGKGKSLESKVTMLMKQVKIARPETKWVEWDTTGNITTSPVVFNLINNIGRGTDQGQFVGQKIHLKNMQLRFTIVRNGATTPAVFRIIIFRFLEDNNGTPTAANILQSTTDPVVQHKNQNLAEDFKIIVDKTMTLRGPYNATDNSGYQLFFDWNLKKLINSIPCKFINGANTIEHGGLYALMCATDTVGFDGRARTFYTDA